MYLSIHIIENVQGHIRNSETFLHQAVRYFADNAEAVLFLTAAAAGLVALGSRVTALPYDPDYDTRRPIL